jgi:hypothetical protein
MNARQIFGHSHNPNIGRARWDGGVTLDMIQDEKRMRNVRLTFIQGQHVWRAEAKSGHRSQDIEFQGCRMTIMVRPMNAKDDASRRTVPGCDFQPINIS